MGKCDAFCIDCGSFLAFDFAQAEKKMSLGGGGIAAEPLS